MKVKLLDEKAKMPVKGSKSAAGYDLCSAVSVDIPPHRTAKIRTGIAIQLPEGTFGGIYARSGLATKEGLRPANCVGIVDEDFRGEVIVALHNDSNETRKIEEGQRVAQLIVQRHYDYPVEVVTELDVTERGTGGFGSTGKN